ncbi:hypothetical protein [Tepidimonas charontis]|uniref:Uncharacterized protein n=1 Tax=Tepidimonas charontis TaxID=2267262 RepID=A0A554X9J1_9BURK|nr:hypothetical protein [Tepidimonas charontis]TSE32487.1 hypothetical protein Tchar_02072 [Tepidimonas charontis]
MNTGQSSCYKSGQFICSLHESDRALTDSARETILEILAGYLAR